MTWGLIARSEPNRGLGVLTRLLRDNLCPDKTLVLTLSDGFVEETSAFPGATVMGFAGEIDERAFRAWADGLDTVLLCETFYDWRIVDWCRSAGVRTILYVMPELLKHELGVTLPSPDEFWYPTTWRLDQCPPGRLLTLPCEARPFVGDPTGEVRMVHVAGRKALGDRNGTQTVFKALAGMDKRRGPAFTTFTQGSEHELRPTPRWHQVVAGPADHWEMYDAHVLVMPRRFGGLCLPVVEALACGMAVVMPGISPNLDWPVVPVKARERHRYNMPCGPVFTHDTDVVALRAAIVAKSDPDTAAVEMARARAWVAANTWDVRRDAFLRELT